MSNITKRAAVLALALMNACTFHLQAAPEKGSRAEEDETKNWSFTPDEELPNVLILGDSISIGYTLLVRELLKGKANVFRPVTPDGSRPVNCSGTTVGLERCSSLLKAHKWDVIHFNWGLHDLKHVKKAGTQRNSNNPNDPQQCAPKEYGVNLQKIVDELRETGAKLIFATTTPVVPGTNNPLRQSEAPSEYNAVASEIMEKNKIRVNDLYALSLPNLKKWQLPKNVHFNRKGSQAFAEQVASVIGEELEK